MSLKGVKIYYLIRLLCLKMGNNITLKPFSSSTSMNRASFNPFLDKVKSFTIPI